MAKRTRSKRASVIAAEKALADTLEKTGYNRLKKGGARSARPPMPEFYGSYQRASKAPAEPVPVTPNPRERSTYDPDFSLSSWADGNGGKA